MLVHELPAEAADVESQRGHRDRGDGGGGHGPAPPGGLRERDPEDEEHGDPGRRPDEELGRLLVCLDGRLGHDALDALLVALAGLHPHEPGPDHQQLRAEGDRPHPAGELPAVDGDGQAEGQERDEHGEGEGQMDDGGMQGHVGTSVSFASNVLLCVSGAMGQMTHMKNTKDHGELHEGREASDVPRRPVLTLLFVSIALVIGADLVSDWLEGGSLSHAAVELAVMMAALAGAAMLVRDLVRARARTKTLARELATSHRDAQRYREEAAELLRGLGETIDRQLDRWSLTQAEKEVAILLLKGLSHQEVADVRGTSERTARKQARAVYSKADLEGRAELSAFFLEDLLPPAQPAASPGKET